MSLNRIREWHDYWEGNVYISFSGGKDSTVLLHLVRSLYPDVPAVFCDTGLEYPEIRNFVKTIPNVIWIRPEMNFKKVVQKYGYPVVSKDVARAIHESNRSAFKYGCSNRETTTYKRKFTKDSDYCKRYPTFCLERWDFLCDAPFLISHMCCEIMKEKPSRKYEKESSRKPFVGTMACESAIRRTNWLKYGCNAFDNKRPSSQPLSFWTEQDVLRYLQENHLPVASVYGEIQEDKKGKLFTTKLRRTGCMFCMFGAHLDKSPNRFECMKETHPKVYDYCMRPVEEGGLGMEVVLNFLNIRH